MRALLTIIVVIFTYTNSYVCFADERSDAIAPTWIKNPPKQLNNSYIFKVVETDAGDDLSSARKHSQKELIRSVEREFNIKVSDALESQSTTHYNNDDISFTGDDTYTLNIESDDGAVNIYYERVDEYYRIEGIGGKRVVRLYTLYAVAQPGVSNPRFDNFIKTNKYGFNGVWRSMIIPGWGQFYKGSKAKGGIMLGGTAALAGVAIFAENKRSNYMRNMDESYSTDNKRYYADKADGMSNLRNICIGGAAALYIYNLIDAAVSPGAKRVKVTKRGNPKPNFSFMPTASYDMNGFAARATF